MKKRLFNIAWSIRKQFATFGEALTHAWRVVKLQFCLCTQAVVNFKYTKVDGSVRQAVGTLESVPAPKGGKPVNYGVLVYWDLVAAAYRSCRVENLMF